jgi:hypothetical protein
MYRKAKKSAATLQVAGWAMLRMGQRGEIIVIKPALAAERNYSYIGLMVWGIRA